MQDHLLRAAAAVTGAPNGRRHADHARHQVNTVVTMPLKKFIVGHVRPRQLKVIVAFIRIRPCACRAAVSRLSA